MEAKIRVENGNALLEINGKQYPFAATRSFRPQPSVLTDCFTGERIRVDAKGTHVIFKPHETKFYTVLPQKE